ncbi:MAG: hypothetical protein VX593_11495, partial [Pseudomonadota bacterium]|nr:hypothetical protein [Pseudomonadota bacterium]
ASFDLELPVKGASRPQDFTLDGQVQIEHLQLMRLLSPHAQPEREPGDPGPDWRPRFGLNQALRWTLEGVLIPLLVFGLVWLVASFGYWAHSDDKSLQRATANGGALAILGFLLSGGGLVLTWIFAIGVRWSTVFRVMGAILAMIAQWNLSGWLLEQW